MSRTYKDAPRWLREHRGFKRPRHKGEHVIHDSSIRYSHNPDLIGAQLLKRTFRYVKDYYRLTADRRDEVIRQLDKKGTQFRVVYTISLDGCDNVDCWGAGCKTCARYSILILDEGEVGSAYADRCTCGEPIKEWKWSGYNHRTPYTKDGYAAPCFPLRSYKWQCSCNLCTSSSDARENRARASLNLRMAVKELDAGYMDGIPTDRLTYDIPNSNWC